MTEFFLYVYLTYSTYFWNVPLSGAGKWLAFVNRWQKVTVGQLLLQETRLGEWINKWQACIHWKRKGKLNLEFMFWLNMEFIKRILGLMFHNVKNVCGKTSQETKKTFLSLRQINLEAQLILSAKMSPYLEITIKKYGFYLGISILLKSYYYMEKINCVKCIVLKVLLLGRKHST